MKQKDIIVIVAAALVSGIFSFVLANFLFGGEKAYKLTAPTIEPISAEFKSPESKYFNRNSVNPTKLIIIGPVDNQTPFKTQ